MMPKFRNGFCTEIKSRAALGKRSKDKAMGMTVKPSVKILERFKMVPWTALQTTRILGNLKV